jgi:iron(II)-dependent oxidoreductase
LAKVDTVSRLTVSLTSHGQWRLLERDGFTLHVETQRESPLAFALSVAHGLDSRPRRLDASYLYDASGSTLFERITEQPEYYLTRAEDRLLQEHGKSIRELAGPGMLVELGSGASLKTQRLLDAWTAVAPSTYLAVDVDPKAIEQACIGLRQRYPDPSRLELRGLASTYEHALSVLRGSAPMTILFLGSSLGNLGWREYPEFCRQIAEAMLPGDHFLVGLDLVKDPSRIEAAYNDAAGVTEAFTRNLFARMNRELDTDIPSEAIRHVAYYDPKHERVEIFAEALSELTIDVAALGRRFRIARGERILTELSHKFRPASFIATVEAFGLQVRWHAVGDGDFGLFLFRKPKNAPSSAPAPNPSARHLALLAEARVRTRAILAPLSDSDLSQQHSPLMSPIAWDLGHIAQFEAQWALPANEQDRVLASNAAQLYDAVATPRAERSQLPLPAVHAVWEQLDGVRREVEQHFTATGEGDPSRSLPAGAFTLPLVVQHEAQHQETILQAIALRHDLVYEPTFAAEPPTLLAGSAATERVLIPGGPFIMGTDDRSWAYDNERPAHEVQVPTFWLGRSPVTNSEYQAFIADGGYEQRRFWTEAGWAWLQETKCRAPAHWRPLDEHRTLPAQNWQALVFGRLEPLHPDGIVLHVSWYEADAYARWAGGRLPTEAEWEKAAAWDPTHGRARLYPWGDEPWQPERGNLDQTRLQPTRSNAYSEGQSAYGCLQMLGDVWEWTSSWFGGYPGFQSFPYDEYSRVFFEQGYRVLRGGSFASRAVVMRNTFRNWDYPQRRQIFAGFRCAWSA